MMMTDEFDYEFNETTTVPVLIELRPNCSVNSPCGSHGYCQDNTEGKWTCVCKFWWNGTTCEEMTGSGKQVIILGALLGLLLIIFYGLELFHYIRKRKKQSKGKKSEVEPMNVPRKLSTTSSIPESGSRHILSAIIFLVTLLLTAGTLIAKWRILQPIHDEIVDKFHRNQSLTFKKNSICDIFEIRTEFNIITFPAACLMIIIFVIITKRVAFKRGRGFKGYVSLPIPMDFFSHVRRTFSAVVFAIFADELLDIVNQMFRRGRTSSNDGVIVRYLRQLFRVLVIGFRRYPILAAINIDTPLSLGLASLYTWLDFSITIVNTGFCRSDFYLVDKNDNSSNDGRLTRYFNYYGTGSNLVFFQLLSDIPQYFFMSYICVKLMSLLIKRIRHRHRANHFLTREQKTLLYSSLPYSVESCYIRNLLEMGHMNPPMNRFRRSFRFIYDWRDDFRFSARVVCVYAAVFLLLFFMTVQALVRIPPTLLKAGPGIQDAVDLLMVVYFTVTAPDLKPNEGDSSSLRLPPLDRAYYGAIAVTVVIIIIQLLTMLSSIRRNLLQAFRGDHTEIPPPRTSRNVTYVTGNFRFAGTLIGYVVLAYVLLGFFTFILTILIGTYINFGNSRFIESLLKLLIPVLLFIYFKTYLNRILAKYVFLQHKVSVLSLNNRRVFMVFLYFNIFLDAFLGLFAAIIRLLKSFFGGIIYMCRLDYSPLGRKLETRDPGFSSYCGFIHVECAHRHPVLLYFLSHLLRDSLYGSKTKPLSKARRKWALAVFLLNNPKLIYQRKKYYRRTHDDEAIAALIEKRYDSEMHFNYRPTLSFENEKRKLEDRF